MDTQAINQTIDITSLLGYELKRAGAPYSVGPQDNEQSLRGDTMT
jgi:hypothetical protein